ncbi:unnamed protein product [Prorocentrum cordatum]|uniref:Uncharacterized protein n=1 Tax=Prorocentrum cordatum TaxID=2364126 RepID=A0ABN9RVS5_9DINO|nr:unnamed protein product [Polarella glacialis]
MPWAGREREKEDEFEGHPWGKRPDAQMKMVLYRITEALQANEAAVEAAIQQGPDPSATKQAVKCIAEWSTRVQDTTTIFHATRCFMVTTQDTANHEVKKWIFATCHHPELQQAFMQLRDNGGALAAGLLLERDTAPRSKAAKTVERLAFKAGKQGKTKGKGSKRQKH